jgi:hypothetical protein
MFTCKTCKACIFHSEKNEKMVILLPLTVYQKICVNRLQSYHLPYPSKAQSSTPIIRRKVCYSLMFWYPPQKFWRFACIQNLCDEVQFTVFTLHGPENSFPPLPLCQAPTHYCTVCIRIYKCTSFHWAIYKFDTFLLNKLNCCKPYQANWKARYKFDS